MKVIISGSSSYVGQKIIENLSNSELNLNVVSTQRVDPSKPNFLDLSYGFSGLEKCDFFVHVGWIMQNGPKYQKSNEMISKEIIEKVVNESGKVIFLSTLSALVKSSSYGASKAKVESKVLKTGGYVIRAGLIRPYDESKGIISLLTKLSNFSPVLPQLFPDGGLLTTSIDEICREINKLITKKSDNSSGQIVYCIDGDLISINRLLQSNRKRVYITKVFVPLYILRLISRVKLLSRSRHLAFLANIQALKTLKETNSLLMSITEKRRF